MFNLILIIFISFIPIIFWAYIFSNISGYNFSRKNFIIGIFSGIISVVPILFLEKILNSLKISFINFFQKALEIKTFLDSLYFSFSLDSFLLLLFFVNLIFFLFTRKKEKNFLLYSFITFLIISFIISIFFFLIYYFLGDYSKINIYDNIKFGQIIFDSFYLTIFYYIIIAFLEESSKFFSFISSPISVIKTKKQGLLFSIYITLGFVFIENILYLSNYLFVSGNNIFNLSFEFFKIYFFRNISSLILHLFCSSIISYFFIEYYFNKKKYILSFIKKIFFGSLIAIFIHFIFDFFLTIGLNFILIVSTFIGYIFVSSIFYNDNITTKN